MTSGAIDIEGAPGATVGLRGGSRRHLDTVVLVIAAVLVAVALAGVFASVLAPYNPDQPNILAANAGISGHHLLGTDSLGRDILSRMLYATQLSLLGPAIVVVVATTLGTALALWSAWKRGPVDAIVSRILDLLFATPSLLLAIIGVAILGTGVVAPVVALSIAYTPWIARVARTVALEERSKPYVEAYELVGMSGWRVSLKHIVANMPSVIIAQATITFGAALVDLAAISFLGLGVQPPGASWGLMISDGESAFMAGHVMEVLAPGVAIVGVVVLVNLLGARARAT